MNSPSVHLLLVGAALALAGCGQQGPVAEDAEQSGALPAPASVEVSSPSGAPPPPNASAQPTPSNTAAGAAAVLPAALRGRWGLTPGDCAGAGSNGLLVIEDRALRFYESQAVPTGNVEAGADSFSADFAFTGEGMTWTKFQSLQIQNGNLIRTESSPMASFTYAKCS